MSDWKQDLDAFFRAKGEAPHPSTTDLLKLRNEEARAFIEQTVMPAFTELHAALARYGRQALLSTAHQGRLAASIRVRNEGRDEFEYLVSVRVTPDRAFPYVELVAHPRWPRRTQEDTFREGIQDYSASDITTEEVIAHFLSRYEAHLPA